MGIVKKQGIPTAIFTYFGVLIAFVNGAILFPKTVGASIFGFTQWVMAVLAISTLFGDFSTSKLVVKYLPYFRESKKRHNGFVLMLLVLTTLGVVVTLLLGYFFKANVITWFSNEESVHVVRSNYRLVFIGITFFIYNTFLTAYCKALFRTRVPTFFNELFGKLFNSILLISFFFGLIDINQFLWAYVLKFGLQLISLVFYIKWLEGPFPSLTFEIPKLGKRMKKEMAQFGGTVFLSGSSSVLTNKIDILMISSFIGFEQTGIYAILLYMTVAMTIPYKSLISIMAPLVSDAWKFRDMDTLKSLYVKSSLNSSTISFLIFLLLAINSGFILNFLGPAYVGYDWVLYYLCAGTMVYCLCGSNGLIMNYSPYFKYDIIIKLSLVALTVGTNYIFIPIYGIKGAAMATALSVSLNNLLISLLIYIKSGIHPFTLRTVALFGLFALGFVVNYFIPELNNAWTDAVLRSVIVSAVFLGLLYKTKLSSDINEMIDKGLVKIGIKK